MFVHYYSLIISLPCLYFLLLTLSNIYFFRKNSFKPRYFDGPRVSVMVPARNEERNLRRCLESLVHQCYKNYEILILDDNSTDATWQIIQEYVARYPALVKGYQGRPLPPDWYGKPHALQQLASYASGEIFLFTDADTEHRADSVAFAVTNMMTHNVDYLSGYALHEMKTLGEKIVLPSMYIMTSMVLPLFLIPRTKNPLYSFSIGQYVVFRRQAFEAMGGYESIKQEIVDDVFMARQLKAKGYKTIFLDAKQYVSCRMYENYHDAINGICKNIYPSIDKQFSRLCGMVAFMFAVVLLPLFIWLAQLITLGPHMHIAALPVGLFALVWMLKLYDRGVNQTLTILYPILFLDLVRMSFKSFFKLRMGKGFEWKGRWVK